MTNTTTTKRKRAKAPPQSMLDTTPRDARTNPRQRAKCRTCDGGIIEPSIAGEGRKGEGQWIHLVLPLDVHPAMPA